MPRVTLAITARAELRDIIRFIREKNRAGATRIKNEFERVFRILAKQPDIGTACERLGAGMRYITVENYVVLFRRGANRVEVLAISHGAQDWEKLL